MSFFEIFTRPLRPVVAWGRQHRRVKVSVFIALTLSASAVDAVNCQNNLPASNPDTTSYQVDAAAGVVTDIRTGLMWKRTEEATIMTWAAALSAAEASTYAGYSDWRLPNIKELRSLVEECRANPSINDTVFPGASSSYVWSGSPTRNIYGAWSVYFNDGVAFAYASRLNSYSVRLVRGGQSFGNLVNGACGTAAGVATVIAPAANLCASGTSSGATSANGSWGWTCSGTNGGTNVSCSAPALGTITAISPSAGWLQVGETTPLVVTPRGATGLSCTSSDPAVISVAGTTLTAKARGNATITCNGVSTTVKVRTPWVTAISPGTAMVGDLVEFSVTGYDLRESDLVFSLSNCSAGSAVPLAWWDLLPSTTFTYGAVAETRRFTCVPLSAGQGVLTVEPASPDNRPGNNYADRRLRTAAFGGCAATNSCTVMVSPSSTGLSPEASAFLVLDSAKAVGVLNAATNEINWNSLTPAQAQAFQARLRLNGIAVDMPQEWINSREEDNRVLNDRGNAAMREMFGQAAIDGYTYRDMFKLDLYTGWARTTMSAYTGGDWLKLSGGIIINGATAIGDAVPAAAIATKTLKFSKAGRKLLKATRAIKALPSLNRMVRLATWINQSERLGQALEVGGAAWTAWSKDESIAFAAAATALKVVGADKLTPLLTAPTLAISDEAADIISNFNAAVLLQAPLEALEAGLTGAEIRAISAILLDGATDALPIVGPIKDMAELSAAIADKAYGKYFDTSHDLTKTIGDAQAQVILRYQVANLRRIFLLATDRVSAGNMVAPPPTVPADLPQAWGALGYMNGVQHVMAISHGWNASAFDWPRKLLGQFCSRLGGSVTSVIPSNLPELTGVADYCNVNGTLAFTYNWKTDAEILESDGTQWVRMPTGALTEATRFGDTLGKKLYGLGLRATTLHAVGHSAGSGLVEALAKATSDLTPSTLRHSTFLDAYCPDPWLCNFGASATFAEQYFHTGPDIVTGGLAVLAPGMVSTGAAAIAMYTAAVTGVTLKSAYNFDLSALHVATDVIDSHAFPYNAYLRSAGDSTAPSPLLSQIGAPLGRVYGGALFPAGVFSTSAAAEYPKGALCRLSSGTIGGRARVNTPGECAVVIQPPPAPPRTDLTPIFGAGSTVSGCPFANAPVGQVRTAMCATAVVSTIALKAVGNAVTPSATTLALTTSTAAVDLSLPVGAVSFDYEFGASSSGSNVQVFVNDRLVAVLDPTRATNNIGRVQDALFQTVSPGRSYVQVILRAPPGSAATFALRNLTFASAKLPACSWDFDGDGRITSNDALIFNRWVLGFRDASLVAGITTVPVGSTSAAFAAAVTDRMAVSFLHDLDGDTLRRANTDGILFSRLVAGMTGSSVTQGAAGSSASRNSYELIRTHINASCGTSFGGASGTTPTPSLTINTDPASLTALGAVFPAATGYSFVVGQSGRTAVKFFGVNNRASIRIPNQAAMQFTTAATWDLWARIDSSTGLTGNNVIATSGWAMALMAKSHDNGSVALSAYSTDANYAGTGYGFAAWSTSVAGWGSASCTIITRNPGVPLGTWFRMTAVASTTTGTQIYANKALIYTCPNAVPNFAGMNASDLYLGVYSGDFWYPLDGAVQDIRIYQRALTNAEVQALP